MEAILRVIANLEDKQDNGTITMNEEVELNRMIRMAELLMSK